MTNFDEIVARIVGEPNFENTEAVVRALRAHQRDELSVSLGHVTRLLSEAETPVARAMLEVVVGLGSSFHASLTPVEPGLAACLENRPELRMPTLRALRMAMVRGLLLSPALAERLRGSIDELRARDILLMDAVTRRDWTSWLELSEGADSDDIERCLDALVDAAVAGVDVSAVLDVVRTCDDQSGVEKLLAIHELGRGVAEPAARLLCCGQSTRVSSFAKLVVRMSSADRVAQALVPFFSESSLTELPHAFFGASELAKAARARLSERLEDAVAAHLTSPHQSRAHKAALTLLVLRRGCDAALVSVVEKGLSTWQGAGAFLELISAVRAGVDAAGFLPLAIRALASPDAVRKGAAHFIAAVVNAGASGELAIEPLGKCLNEAKSAFATRLYVASALRAIGASGASLEPSKSHVTKAVKAKKLDDDIEAGEQREWLAAKAVLHGRFFARGDDAQLGKLLPDCVAALGITAHDCAAFRVDARDLLLSFAAQGPENRQLIVESGLRRVTASFVTDEGNALCAACGLAPG